MTTIYKDYSNQGAKVFHSEFTRVTQHSNLSYLFLSIFCLRQSCKSFERFLILGVDEGSVYLLPFGVTSNIFCPSSDLVWVRRVSHRRSLRIAVLMRLISGSWICSEYTILRCCASSRSLSLFRYSSLKAIAWLRGLNHKESPVRGYRVWHSSILQKRVQNSSRRFLSLTARMMS